MFDVKYSFLWITFWLLLPFCLKSEHWVSVLLSVGLTAWHRCMLVYDAALTTVVAQVVLFGCGVVVLQPLERVPLYTSLVIKFCVCVLLLLLLLCVCMCVCVCVCVCVCLSVCVCVCVCLSVCLFCHCFWTACLSYEASTPVWWVGPFLWHTLCVCQHVPVSFDMMCLYVCTHLIWSVWVFLLFPVNMPDLIQKHFGYGQLWPLQPAWSQNQAGYDFLHPIQFSSSGKGPDHIVQNQPRSDLDGLVLFWPNASGPEANQCARIIGPGSGRMQMACYQFSTFRLGCVLSISLDHIVQNQPRSDLVLADCVRFWPNRSGPETNWCARITGPASGQHFWADPDQMQTRSSMFTGYKPVSFGIVLRGGWVGVVCWTLACIVWHGTCVCVCVIYTCLNPVAWWYNVCLSVFSSSNVHVGCLKIFLTGWYRYCTFWPLATFLLAI